MVTADRPAAMRPVPAGELAVEHLERMRYAELTCVRKYFHPGCRVVELGGGSGFQASVIATWGCHVDSFDLASGESAKRFAPVKTYDAERLPVVDNSVDVVFSSNVLEHIGCLKQTFQEIMRVLKPGGTAVHILPTPAWRFWTTVGRYVELARRVSLGARNDEPGTSHQSLGRRAGPADLIKRALPLMAHGVYPNAASELYYFSRQRWLRVFRSAGFQLVSTGPAGIFYTGYENLPRLSTRARRRLAAVLGSSCTVFVMRPAR